MTTVFTFGDTGGHGLQLFTALNEIGVDLETCTIPEGVVIVHLGDLIHKGPVSNTIVSRVDKLIRNNPGQWLQVLGNHEFQHIEEGIDFWSCNCSLETQTTIQAWHNEGLARIAWAVEDVLPNKWTNGNRPLGQERIVSSFLATHAGLTYPVWKSLESPMTATEAADGINANGVWCARAAGEMLGMSHKFGVVGPVWAKIATETFQYWDLEAKRSGVKMPFGQLMGHNAPFDFSSEKWWADVSKNFRTQAKVLTESRRTICFVADSVLICMDPGYGKKLDFQLHATQPYLEFKTGPENAAIN